MEKSGASLAGAVYVGLVAAMFVVLAFLFGDDLTFVGALLLTAIPALPLGAVFFTKYTAPGTRRVVSTITGDILVLRPGIAFCAPWPFTKSMESPFCNIAQGSAWPQAGARVPVDPSAFQIHSAEGVEASIDVCVECTVANWEPSTSALVADRAPISRRAFALINLWLSQHLSGFPADSITYGSVSETLNTAEVLQALNRQLASECYLLATRVVVDPNGVVLDAKYSQRRKEIHARQQEQRSQDAHLAKEAELQTLRQRNTAQQNQFEWEQEQKKVEAARDREVAQAECAASLERLRLRSFEEKAKAEAQRARHFIDAGMLPEQVVQLMVAQANAEALRGAKGTVLVPQPGAVGFGVNGLHGALALENDTAGA